MASSQKGESGFEALEREYCPPIDNALFYAIASDFDLSNAAGIKAAREVMDEIKATASEQEQDANFDPSGTSFFSTELDGAAAAAPESSVGRQTPTSTDVTSLSNGLRGLELTSMSSSSLASDMEDSNGANEGVHNADEATKVMALTQMFPHASEYSVRHTLKSCKGDHMRAMEELLNHDFFNNKDRVNGEDRILAKGIDGFSQDSLAVSYHQRRKHERAQNKRNKKRNRTAPVSADEDDDESNSGLTDVADMWNKGQEDIDFIASRTCIPRKTISPMYYMHGASLASTLKALLESPATFESASKDTESRVKELAAELEAEFQSLPQHLFVPLIQVTYPSTASAHELAKALLRLRRQPRPPRSGSVPASSSKYNPGITPQYAPVAIPPSDEELYSSLRNHSISQTPYISQRVRNGSRSGISYAEARQAAAQFDTRAHSAFQSASAAHRRGRSDRLMGAAASYYSQVGHDMAMKRDEASGKAATALVAAQSRPGEVDLHGTSVEDAVRIASGECANWWLSAEGRGVKGMDGRVFRGDNVKTNELKIITGVGRHSHRGVSKIGPAVRKMLDRENWRFVEATSGCFIVTGKR